MAIVHAQLDIEPDSTASPDAFRTSARRAA
jgi:hypothetical protein